jgi:glycosyltransferase involved in cell wall biosynthesis
MEAMACGLPTIGTGWGGNVDFMSTENSLLVGSKLVPVPEKGWRELATYKGHLWAEPDAGQLRSHLRWVASNRQAAKELGATARRHVLANFSRESAGPNVAAALASIIRQKSAIVKPDSQTLEYKSDPMHVRWEGAILRQHSLSHVNRELVQQLIDLGVDITLVPTEPTELVAGDDSALLRLQDRHFAPLTAPADVHVRHGFPPRFGVPDEGHFVLMQPWEYGYLPKEWLAKIEHEVTEVWCNSKYVMGVYANSGVPKKKLRHIPLGVDTSLFNEEALPYVFTDEPGAFRLGESTSGDPFMFLYVGGTIQRKGFDILLDAYLKAFSAYDNVALVVKATGTRTVYSDSNYGERLTELANDPSRPRIVYIDTDLSAREMAGVYRAADLLVAPYRGEGFCLPALESLACGTPVLVTRGGPTDDFVDETVGWRVPALKLAFDESKIGHGECAGPTWMFEVDPIDLAKQLRSLSNQKEECRSRGAAGAKRVADNWTWRHSAQRVLKRLAVLKVRPQTKVEKRPSAAGIVKAAGKIARLSSGDGSKPTISLCMIVKNEERVLGDCLTSIKPWVDEIIVVDTGSTDRTVAIAEESGARVFHFPWTDSFSEARNESLRHATGEWILWMDADDTIFPESGAKLRDAAMLASEKVAGLIMQVRIPAAAGEYGETVVDHVKLFRNGIGLQFEGRIHEQILEPIYRAGGEIQRTDLFVVHSGYDYSPEGQKAKRVRDLRLLELDLADRPDHPFVLFNIGMTAFHMRDFSKSIDYLKRCLSVCRKDESVVRKVYAMLAGASFETGNHLEAVRWLDKGLGLYPRDPELLFRGGAIFRETGNAAKAEECYLKLLADRESGHIDSIDQTMTGFKAHHNLAILYQETGRPEKAKSEFAAAVNLQPDFMPSRMALAALSA